jgi:adenine-specific DNA-methyltransferase
MLESMATSTPANRHHRKALGAFYSPDALVGPLVDWAVNRADQSVLDPSCGDGVFLQAAARRLLRLGASRPRVASLLRGVDLNPAASQVTRARLGTELGIPFSNVSSGSFFALHPPGDLFATQPQVDVVVGNPPYIRYQEFVGSVRREARSRALDSGVRLNQLASSWAHFVAHAMSFLRPDGRLALILPAELIHAGYAGPLREGLRRSFEEIHVVSFRQAVFPDVQEEIVFLLAEGRGRGPGVLRLVEVESGDDLTDFSCLLSRSEIHAAGESPSKWIPGYSSHPGVSTLEALVARSELVPLSRVGKANIGFVSGANDYFVLTAEEARDWGLPETSLRPALVRARQLPWLQITKSDLQRLWREEERFLLWLPEGPLTPAEEGYVRQGVELGLPERYKCRVRRPWFRVPGVVAPDAFLTYMSDVVPRFCLNTAGVVASNNLLAIRLTGVPSRIRKAFVVAFYNSATLLSCERIGRAYGGGVLKLEPSEADRVLVPAVERVAAHAQELARLAPGLAAALQGADRKALEEAVDRVDAVLFGRNPDGFQALAAARVALQERRESRARSLRTKGSPAHERPKAPKR